MRGSVGEGGEVGGRGGVARSSAERGKELIQVLYLSFVYLKLRYIRDVLCSRFQKRNFTTVYDRYENRPSCNSLS